MLSLVALQPRRPWSSRDHRQRIAQLKHAIEQSKEVPSEGVDIAQIEAQRQQLIHRLHELEEEARQHAEEHEKQLREHRYRAILDQATKEEATEKKMQELMRRREATRKENEVVWQERTRTAWRKYGDRQRQAFRKMEEDQLQKSAKVAKELQKRDERLANLEAKRRSDALDTHRHREMAEEEANHRLRVLEERQSADNAAKEEAQRERDEIATSRMKRVEELKKSRAQTAESRRRANQPATKVEVRLGSSVVIHNINKTFEERLREVEEADRQQQEKYLAEVECLRKEHERMRLARWQEFHHKFEHNLERKEREKEAKDNETLQRLRQKAEYVARQQEEERRKADRKARENDHKIQTHLQRAHDQEHQRTQSILRGNFDRWTRRAHRLVDDSLATPSMRSQS